MSLVCEVELTTRGPNDQIVDRSLEMGWQRQNQPVLLLETFKVCLRT